MRAYPIRDAVAQPLVGASFTTPIVVTTTQPHWIQSGEQVLVDGVSGNEAANGTWTALVDAADAYAVTLVESIGVDAFVPANNVGRLTPLDAQKRLYAANRNHAGAVITMPKDLLHGSLGTLTVSAESNPTTASKGVWVVLEGRAAADSGWTVVGDLDDADTWTMVESLWTAVAADLKLYPQMRIRVAQVIGSTNRVKAWLVT